MDEAARHARAEARRRRITLRKTRLRDPELDDAPVRGAEAVSLVHRLTLESWALAGLELPTYSREATPIRFVRRDRA